MDDAKADVLQKAIERALVEVGKTHGVTFGKVACSYDKVSAYLKVVATEEGCQTLEERNFIAYAYQYGLSFQDLGRKFRNSKGQIFKITGLSTGSRQYPILAEEIETGKTWKFTAKNIDKQWVEDTTKNQC